MIQTNKGILQGVCLTFAAIGVYKTFGKVPTIFIGIGLISYFFLASDERRAETMSVIRPALSSASSIGKICLVVIIQVIKIIAWCVTAVIVFSTLAKVFVDSIPTHPGAGATASFVLTIFVLWLFHRAIAKIQNSNNA